MAKKLGERARALFDQKTVVRSQKQQETFEANVDAILQRLSEQILKSDLMAPGVLERAIMSAAAKGHCSLDFRFQHRQQVERGLIGIIDRLKETFIKDKEGNRLYWLRQFCLSEGLTIDVDIHYVDAQDKFIRNDFIFFLDIVISW